MSLEYRPQGSSRWHRGAIFHNDKPLRAGGKPSTCDFYNIPWFFFHYSDVIMSPMASQITDISIVYSTVWSGADQRKHQSSASLAFVRGIHRWPVNFPHKGPATRKMFPFDDVIILSTLGIFTSYSACWNVHVSSLDDHYGKSMCLTIQ